MGLIWIIIVPLLALALLFRPWLLRNSHKKLPPGPKGFPILGCLHLLGKLPHRDFHRLSQRYGPIMHMKLGLVHTIIVSSPEAAELFLKTHDLVFASRPHSEVINYIFHGQKDVLFAPYGSYWRNMRKTCTLELLSSHKISSFESVRREEVGLLIEDLREAAKSGVAVDLTSKIFSLTLEMTCLVIFGRKYEGEEVHGRSFKWLLREASRLGAAPNLADFIPCIAPLDLQGLNRRAKFVNKVLDGFLESIIDEHLRESKNHTKDFVDAMLDILGSRGTEYQINRSDIKAVIFDMVLGAVDTSATTMGWVLFELIKHPQVMKKLQEELENVVGLNRKVEESDLGHMKYLDMIVKETLRLHPPGPILAPHESLEDCTINNFFIPKRSRIIVNAWAIARDPSVWTNAEKFFPERFIDSKVDLKGRDFQLIPFGAGRRSCPGIHMALIVVHLIIAQLVHCFDWKLPGGILPTELDITEEFGLTCPRVQDLIVTPIYRGLSSRTQGGLL
ncbi:cytochrome P450 CYP736A12-like [Momordica charantia]|uniref:Cytochrome P450 CYP736A12-like n=1 Tax=Momordica charantia TaxID=3673 RepID=A0A6J1BWD4_MOMCH|nr:cytochrome P450 CYP736A12-like [Momordica charantia]